MHSADNAEPAPETAACSHSGSLNSAESARKDPWKRFLLFFFMMYIGGAARSRSGIIYWGWYGVQDLLYKAGSFSELCSGEADVSYVTIGRGEYVGRRLSPPDCAKRKNGINNLFTLAYSSQFAFTIVIGMLMDCIGPRFTYMLSHATHFTAWLLVGLFPRIPWVLRLAFFLMGATSQGLSLPLTTRRRASPAVSYFFSKHRAFVICMIGSALSLSYMNPLIMAKIFEQDCFTPRMVYVPAVGYAVVGNLLCFVLGIFFLHRTVPPQTPPDKLGQELPLTVEADPKEPELAKPKSLGTHVLDVLRTVRSREFLVLLLCYSLFLTSFEFVNKAQREILVSADGRTSVHLFKYLQFLNFLPSPLFGYLIDKIGPAIVMWNMFLLVGPGHAQQLAFFVVAALDYYAAKMTAIWFYYLVGVACISNLISYIAKRFPQEYYGTLLGIVMLSVGLLSLTNIPLYNASTGRVAATITKKFHPAIFLMIVGDSHAQGYLTTSLVLGWYLVRVSTKKRTGKSS